LGTKTANINAEREREGITMFNSGQGLCTLLPVNSKTKFSVTLGLGLSQYKANKRTPFPTVTTEECNETCRRKVKVNIFYRKKKASMILEHFQQHSLILETHLITAI
jgi:hypothetical protein